MFNKVFVCCDKDQVAGLGWPGLAIETRNICEAIGISDINSYEVSKKDILKAVKAHDGIELQEGWKSMRS